MSHQDLQSGEFPVVFRCEGSELLGIVHRPQTPAPIGVLTLVAGGPQYRGGCGRQLVSMGRALAQAGIPVMRFDHRGLGDSAGDFLGFQHVESDLRAAIDCFMESVPGLQQVVLWGGCDAASAVLIHAWQLPAVAGIALGNPFVSSDETRAVVTRQHYRKRLTQWSFWRKVLRFEYDFGEYARAFLARRSGSGSGGGSGSGAAAPARASFIDRMLEGLVKFRGPVLLVMSGQSLVSREFDALVGSSPAWAKAYDASAKQRVDLPEADQTFSTGDSRERVNRAISDWVAGLQSAEPVREIA